MKRVFVSLVAILLISVVPVHASENSMQPPERLTDFGLNETSGLFSNDLREYVSLPGYAVFQSNSVGDAKALTVFDYSDNSTYTHVPELPERQNYRNLVKVNDQRVAYSYVGLRTVSPAIFDVETKQLAVSDAVMYRYTKSNIYQAKNLASGSDKVFFPGWDQAHGDEVWVFDGENSSMVFDVISGAESSRPRNFAADDQYVYFYAKDSTGQYELFWFDHTIESPTPSDLNQTDLDLGMFFDADKQMGIQTVDLFGEKFLFFSTGTSLLSLKASNGAVNTINLDYNTGDYISSPVIVAGSFLYVAYGYPTTSLELYRLTLAGDQLTGTHDQTIFDDSNVHHRVLTNPDVSADASRVSYLSRTTGEWQLNFVQAFETTFELQQKVSTSAFKVEDTATLDGVAFEVSDADPPNYFLNAGVIPGPRNLVVSQPMGGDITIYELGGVGQNELTQVAQVDTRGSGMIDVDRIGVFEGMPMVSVLDEGETQREIYALTPDGLLPFGYAQAQRDAGFTERPTAIMGEFEGGFYLAASSDSLWKYDGTGFTSIGFATGYSAGFGDASTMAGVDHTIKGAIVGSEFYFVAVDGFGDHRLWRINASGKIEKVESHGLDTLNVQGYKLVGFGDTLILNPSTSGKSVLVYNGSENPKTVSKEDPAEQLHVDHVEIFEDRVIAIAEGDIRHRVFEIVDLDSSPSLSTAAEFPQLSASSLGVANIDRISKTNGMLQIAVYDDAAINDALIYDFDGQSLKLNEFLTQTPDTIFVESDASSYGEDTWFYFIVDSTDQGHMLYEYIADADADAAGQSFYDKSLRLTLFFDGQKYGHEMTDRIYLQILGMDNQGAYTWTFDYEYGLQIYFHPLSDRNPIPVNFSSAATYPGPIIESIDGNTIIGQRLELIEQLFLGGQEVEFAYESDQIEVDVYGLQAGDYDLTARWQGGTIEPQLRLNVQSLPQFWTKQISETEIKLYAKDIVGIGKIQFFHNGNEVAWVRAVDDSEPKLRVIPSGPMTGANYLVRTREMVEGKNVFEIYVDGERVVRRAQGN